jgi:hypothetical protein
VVSNIAIFEGPQLYSQIKNLTISNGTLNAISSNEVCGLKVLFFNGDDWYTLKEETKTYLMAQSSPPDSIFNKTISSAHP